MKYIIFPLIALLLLPPKHINAQQDDKAAHVAAAAITVGVALIGTAAAYDAFIERLEHQATEYVMRTHPEFTQFQLQLMNLRGEKITNFSDISSCTFKVEPLGHPSYVMFWILSQGWWNEFGVDYNRLVVEEFDAERWKEVLWAFFKCGTGISSGSRDSIPVYKTYVAEGTAKKVYATNLKKNPTLDATSFEKIIHDPASKTYRVLMSVVSFDHLISARGHVFRFRNSHQPNAYITIPMRKLNGDTYVIEDVSNLRMVYNERSVLIFFTETGDLVKVRNVVFDNITHYLLALQMK